MRDRKGMSRCIQAPECRHMRKASRSAAVDKYAEFGRWSAGKSDDGGDDKVIDRRCCEKA